MTETMVNGMKFRVWNDTTKRATFAESEDGRVKKIRDCGYITADLSIRKAIAVVFGLPTFRKNAVKTAKVVEETLVTESKEQNELEAQEVQETVEQTTEVETKIEEMAETAATEAEQTENDAEQAENEAEQTENDAEQAENEAEQTENDAEQAENEAEQAENDAESVSETHDSKDVKTDISKTDELSVTTKTLMTFSSVVSEYLKQRGYIDTS